MKWPKFTHFQPIDVGPFVTQLQRGFAFKKYTQYRQLGIDRKRFTDSEGCSYDFRRAGNIMRCFITAPGGVEPVAVYVMEQGLCFYSTSIHGNGEYSLYDGTVFNEIKNLLYQTPNMISQVNSYPTHTTFDDKLYYTINYTDDDIASKLCTTNVPPTPVFSSNNCYADIFKIFESSFNASSSYELVIRPFVSLSHSTPSSIQNFTIMYWPLAGRVILYGWELNMYPLLQQSSNDFVPISNNPQYIGYANITSDLDILNAGFIYADTEGYIYGLIPLYDSYSVSGDDYYANVYKMINKSVYINPNLGISVGNNTDIFATENGVSAGFNATVNNIDYVRKYYRTEEYWYRADCSLSHTWFLWDERGVDTYTDSANIELNVNTGVLNLHVVPGPDDTISVVSKQLSGIMNYNMSDVSTVDGMRVETDSRCPPVGPRTPYSNSGSNDTRTALGTISGSLNIGTFSFPISVTLDESYIATSFSYYVHNTESDYRNAIIFDSGESHTNTYAHNILVTIRPLYIDLKNNLVVVERQETIFNQHYDLDSIGSLNPDTGGVDYTRTFDQGWDCTVTSSLIVASSFGETIVSTKVFQDSRNRTDYTADIPYSWYGPTDAYIIPIGGHDTVSQSDSGILILETFNDEPPNGFNTSYKKVFEEWWYTTADDLTAKSSSSVNTTDNDLNVFIKDKIEFNAPQYNIYDIDTAFITEGIDYNDKVIDPNNKSIWIGNLRVSAKDNNFIMHLTTGTGRILNTTHPAENILVFNGEVLDPLVGDPLKNIPPFSNINSTFVT